jgi:DNA damage-binding protein 1
LPPPPDKKQIQLGTKPIQLRTFTSGGVSYVFAACDRPTIIYSQNRKLIYSNLNENEVRAARTAASPCKSRRPAAPCRLPAPWSWGLPSPPINPPNPAPHPATPRPLPPTQVNFMAPFNSASFPDSLAIAKEDSLTLGTIDAIQKLHIRAVPLGEQPRRLALQDATRTLAVATAGLLGGMGEGPGP